jgi:hypothetical protein
VYISRLHGSFPPCARGSWFPYSYATNNSYIGFKKLVHDATHPGEEAPPLPNPSTWFPSGSPSRTQPAASQSRALAGRANAAAHDDDDDDESSDLEVASERITIKCPLTLLPMKQPLTSTKCPHSFEKDAILEMIAASGARVGGSTHRGATDGERAVKCPVCEVVCHPPPPFPRAARH